MYFLSQLSGIYFNDVRTNIKNKKEREEINCCELCKPAWLQSYRGGRKEEGEEEEDVGVLQRGGVGWGGGYGGGEECEEVREGLKLLVASSQWASSSTSCSASLFCSSPGQKKTRRQCVAPTSSL